MYGEDKRNSKLVLPSLLCFSVAFLYIKNHFGIKFISFLFIIYSFSVVAQEHMSSVF